MENIMPVLFVGHGSPMNAIEDNKFTQSWEYISKKMPKPISILAISAHYEREDTSVTSNEILKTINDFYGFPRQLYDRRYDCPGSKELVIKIKGLLESVNFDLKWGIDHGVWMYFAKCILKLRFL